jgi:WD40 repeat protein
MSLVDLNKAKEARDKEKENISAIGFKMIGNGFHSGEITEMHTCLQRPILLTMSHEDQTIRLWNYVDNICEL